MDTTPVPNPSSTSRRDPSVLWFVAGAVVLAASALMPWLTVRGTRGAFHASLLYSRTAWELPALAGVSLLLAAVYAWRRWTWPLELMRFLSLVSVVSVIGIARQYLGVADRPRGIEYSAAAMRDLIGDPTGAAISAGPWIAFAAATWCYVSLHRLPSARWPAWTVYALVAGCATFGSLSGHLFLSNMIATGRVFPNERIASVPWLRDFVGLRTEGFVSNSERTPLKTDLEAPNFKLKSISGAEIELAQLRGKRVLINFWATWCGPCIAEMPDLERLYQRYRNADFELLALSGDEEPQKVEPFMKKHGLSFPALFSTINVERDYKVEAYPTSFLIDADGKILFSAVGGLVADRMQHVEEVLGRTAQ